LGLYSVQRQVLVSIRVLKIFVMCLAVWIQIAVLTCLVVISSFFLQIQKFVCAVTGLPAMFFFKVPYWLSMHLFVRELIVLGAT
jgi:hypothetical protein